jgi:shikimate dehydrogenase
MQVIRTFGLIGYPLSHSFSKKFFTEKFEQEDIAAKYLNFEIDDIAKLPEIIEVNPQLIGINVTIPYKQDIIQYLNIIDDAAKAIGAVNTVKIIRERDGYSLHGFNTDIIGFSESIKPLIKPHHKKALVLGTGGASKAIIKALESMNIEPLLVSRSSKPDCITYNEIGSETMAEYTVVINTTPLGTYPKTDGCPEIPFEEITDKHLLYDLVYNPEKTEFLKRGEAKGADVKNGLDMLHGQALAAWKIWNE